MKVIVDTIGIRHAARPWTLRGDPITGAIAVCLFWAWWNDPRWPKNEQSRADNNDLVVRTSRLREGDVDCMTCLAMGEDA